MRRTTYQSRARREAGTPSPLMAKFLAVLDESGGTLILLKEAGFEELMPSENCWTFRHDVFPGKVIVWHHNGPIEERDCS